MQSTQSLDSGGHRISINRSKDWFYLVFLVYILKIVNIRQAQIKLRLISPSINEEECSGPIVMKPKLLVEREMVQELKLEQ